MAVNTQFSIAVHIMASLGFQCGRELTSAALATSVNTSPSFVRRVLSKLSKAGLVQTATGQAGSCWLARDPRDITLLDVYAAVGAPKAFSIHPYAEREDCVVSCNIKRALEKALAKTQKAMEAGLEEINLAQIISQVRKA